MLCFMQRNIFSAAFVVRRFESKAPAYVEKLVAQEGVDPSAEKDEHGVDFRKLEIYPVKGKREDLPLRFDKNQLEIMPPRHKRMSPNQDWPSVWPTAHSFKASVVPLPLRMGFIKDRLQKKKLPPKKEANLELMKIPNFLHLTPLAIHRHCQAIKKFCNDWPIGLETDEQLDEHFPIQLVYSDYVFAGPSLRDPRSRIVTLKVKLSHLHLNEHARLKMLKLVGDKYDKKTDTLTLVCDRCPARHQNRDYAMYLLTALFHESLKVERWEGEIPEEDRVKYVWEGTRSKKNVLSYLKGADAARSPETLENAEEVQRYKEVMEEYRNEGESDDVVRTFAERSRKLLGLPDLN